MADPEEDRVRPDLEAYDKEWWEGSIKRLTLHAARKLQRRRWRGILGGPAPGGHEAMDVVNTVCRKLIAGVRRWDVKRHPDLYAYLQDQVDSEISNLVRSLDNRRVRRLLAPVEDNGNERPTDPGDPAPNPEVSVVAKELEAMAEDFALGFIDHLAGKTDLLDTVGAVLESADEDKPADWAERLRVPVTEIYNRRKRLQRELKDYIAIRSVPNRKGATTRA